MCDLLKILTTEQIKSLSDEQISQILKIHNNLETSDIDTIKKFVSQLTNYSKKNCCAKEDKKLQPSDVNQFKNLLKKYCNNQNKLYLLYDVNIYISHDGQYEEKVIDADTLEICTLDDMVSKYPSSNEETLINISKITYCDIKKHDMLHKVQNTLWVHDYIYTANHESIKIYFVNGKNELFEKMFKNDNLVILQKSMVDLIFLDVKLGQNF